MVAMQPAAKSYSPEYIKSFEQVKEIIVNIRNIRQSKAISPKNPLELYIKGGVSPEFYPIIKKMANISEIKSLENREDNNSGSSFMVDTAEFFIPLGDLVNTEEELRKIDAEIAHLTGFLASVNKKLTNEKFVASAPKAVVDIEFKKKSDAETKIDKLSKLKNELLKH
jgi:valyl-tRNA synthetase